jgi:hypothetical protein
VAPAFDPTGTPGGPATPRSAAGPVALRRSYLPAPPPISIRPAPMSGADLPAAARDVRGDATPAAARAATATSSAAQGRSSLADATSHLFRAARIADPAVRRFLAGPAGAQEASTAGAASGGSPMPDQSSPGSDTGAAPAGLAALGEGSSLSPGEMDEIIDRIIDKIEERVVDELERRGRRFSPGVF